ncbi:hypothetical protein [Dechloromonas sp. CZR5]|uniref:hypothetical protein n=1 Tax=Dechloromonas sp. CZR5 TaxID=2608630 RepID=UPI00123DD900|nr:hypothetical protein [Dechloromonas sp. CZR5]
MAKVYSCVVWGGLTGKSVTINATTDLVSLTDHGTRNGKGLQFASGTLPSVAGAALALNTTYYTKWISTSTFELYYDASLTSKIDFTSTGAGLILKSALWMGLSTAQKARYGTAGSERAYASMAAANLARSTNSLPGDEDVIEFIEAFDDFVTAAMNLSYGLADTTLWTSTMDGVRTEAFHGGFPGLGYTLTTTGAGCWYHGGNNITTDGLEFCRNNATSAATFCIAPSGSNSYVQKCIVRQTGSGGSQGINVGGPCYILNCIVIGFTGTYGGIYWNGNSGSTIAHCLVVKGGTGITGSASCSASVYNTVSVGNTLNWGASPTYTASRFRGNIGQTTDKLSFAVTPGTTTMTCGGTPNLAINQPVMFDTTGSLPTVGGVALDPSKVYYIRSVTGNNVTIATTYNGVALTFNGAGTGTHNLRLVWATYEAVNAWIDMTDPSLVFKDYANNDFRPAGTGATPAAQAKMVDYSIVTALVNLASDIGDNERPNYNNGGAEYKDAGPFEYDRGYGPRPASGTIALTNIISGSRVLITKAIGGTVLYNDVPGTSLSFNTSHIGDFNVIVRKATASPFYREFQASGTTVADQTTTIKCLQQLDE